VPWGVHPSASGDDADVSAFRAAESAREKDDKANQQNQAKPAAADDGAAKQEEKHNQDQ
jgi:hypothetical protein